MTSNPSSSPPIIALMAPGGMGSKLALKMSQSGITGVLTDLSGRSQATRERAGSAGMINKPMETIVDQADWIISVVPPKDAYGLAEKVAKLTRNRKAERGPLSFVECNAVSPDSVKKIKKLFEGTDSTFIDGAIIGGPPSGDYNPTIYASADTEKELDSFTSLSVYGLNVYPLKGLDASIGSASALKMAHAGIVKGATGLFVTMILSANASSPSTAQGLLHALSISQPTFIDQIIRLVPQMIPKAYRFVKEMEEISSFVDHSRSRAGNTEEEAEGQEGKTFQGLKNTFERVANAHF